MLAIMEAESGCNPEAVNTSNSDRSTDTGLLQINSVHGVPMEELKNPTKNIAVAWSVYKKQGLKAWSVYNNGKYKKFIKE